MNNDTTFALIVLIGSLLVMGITLYLWVADPHWSRWLAKQQRKMQERRL